MHSRQRDHGDFVGAKLALFIGDELLVITRDLRDDIPWPGFLDFPGGGREDGETPEQCALRETHEEVGLVLTGGDLVWRKEYFRNGKTSWLFVAHLPAARVDDIVFGNEGQGWELIQPRDYCTKDMMIPYFCDRLNDYFAAARKRP